MEKDVLLESQIKAMIIEKKHVNICSIAKMYPAYPKSMISGIISVLIVANNWRIEHMHGRIFINSTPIHDTIDKSTIVRHKDGVVLITPKQVPLNNDWIVRSPRSTSRLFFDKQYTIDEVRTAFAKSEKILFVYVTAKRYHKKEVLIEAKSY